MTILSTYVHISDLHFGNIKKPGSLTFLQAVAALLQHGSNSGLMGHHERPLIFLWRYLNSLRRLNPATLLITGDQTAIGRPSQFDEADEYLGTVNPTPHRTAVQKKYQLHDKDWRDRAIPGNHDHWSGVIGRLMLGGPSVGFVKYFHLPTNLLVSWSQLLTTNSGRSINVQFIRINTDADIQPWSPARVRGQGSFSTQLSALAPFLGGRPKNEIRVLLLHHSYSQSIQGHPTILHMDPLSLSALSDFVVFHDIRVLLCGHIHSPQVERRVITDSSGTSIEVLDARCGTTAQRTVSTIRPLLNNYPQLAQFQQRILRKSLERENTLLLHNLVEEDNGDIFWESQTQILKRRTAASGSGFAAANPADFNPPITLLSEKIQVL